MDFVIGVIIILVVAFVGVKIAKFSEKKRVGAEWDGVIVKKYMASYSDEDGNVTKVPTLQIQIGGGKKKRLSVGAETYNSLNEGDRVKKSAGQKDPVKA